MDSAGSPSIFEDSAGSLSIFEDSAGVGAQCPTCARLCTRCVLLQQTCPTYSSMLTQWLERLIAILQDNRRLYADCNNAQCTVHKQSTRSCRDLTAGSTAATYPLWRQHLLSRP